MRDNGGEELAISDSGDIYGLQSNPAVASCGNEFAVTYQRSVNQYDIYLQFIDHYGYKLGNILRLAWTTAHEEEPDVACGGDLDRYVATWSQEFSGASGIGNPSESRQVLSGVRIPVLPATAQEAQRLRPGEGSS